MNRAILEKMQEEMKKSQESQRDAARHKQSAPVGEWPLKLAKPAPSWRPCRKGHAPENKDAWGHCKVCRVEYYHKDPEARKKREREAMRRRRARNMAEYLLGDLKRNAKKRGQEFKIKVADILPLPILCPVLGIKINYSGSEKDRNCWPSVDRFDSRIGYLPGNVRVISYRANRMKGDATLDELKALIAWMEKENERTQETTLTNA
jgi:hypothetical protein